MFSIQYVKKLENKTSKKENSNSSAQNVMKNNKRTLFIDGGSDGKNFAPKEMGSVWKLLKQKIM